MSRSVVLLVLLLSAGCSFMGSSGEEKPNAMLIEVDLQDRHRCSRISPEITVSDIPEGTQSFRVRLEELSTPPRYLGGGVWPHDGSGSIPEGVLTQHYRGACPQDGVPGRYRYHVTALGASEQPLAVRTYTFTQE